MNLSPNNIPDGIHAVCERFRSSNFQVFLVGGSIRDLLRGKTRPNDWDLATDALPSEVISIFSKILSRKHEYEADSYAVTTYGKPESMISALKKLTVDNLSNLTPHPLNVFLNYSHPPVLERIQSMRKLS